MNITGISNYSKATVGLRQGSEIKDQHFKLIYVYPLLFPEGLQQDQQILFRKFITESFLKEIVISNSLNIVGMASQLSLTNSNQNSVAQMIGRSNSTISTINQQSQPQLDPYEIQKRVFEKFELIKKYVESDVRTKKLMPSYEIVTLNNLIDVPVIVGSKGFNANAHALLYILAVAIATNTPLNNIKNVEKIINKLKSTKEKDWYKLIRNIASENPTFRQRWAERLKKDYPRLQLNKITRYFLNKLEGEKEEDQEKKDFTQKPKEDTREFNEIFNLLKLIRNSLDDVLLQFKFILIPQLLKSQTGIEVNNTLETTVTTISSNQKQIFMQMHDKFIELLSSPGTLLLSSVFNLLYPAPVNIYSDPLNPNTVTSVIDNNDLNFLELKEKHFDSLLNASLSRLINDVFSKEITNTLSSLHPQTAKTRVDLLKSLCRSMSEVDDIFNNQVNQFVGSDWKSGVIQSLNFTNDDLNNFVKSITKMSSTFSSLNKRFENVFSQLVNNSQSLLKHASINIYSSIESFINEITRQPNYVSMMSHQLGVDDNKIKKVFIPQINDALFSIFYFFFLYRLQIAICQLMDIVDIEVEAKINDVLDFPNYTLVLPIEVVMGVYSAFVSNSFEKLISDKRTTEILQMNEMRIKGIIKYLCRRIMIPSIIVYDEKQRSMYYQFMYMTQPEKISMSTLSSFTKGS